MATDGGGSSNNKALPSMPVVKLLHNADGSLITKDDGSVATEVVPITKQLDAAKVVVEDKELESSGSTSAATDDTVKENVAVVTNSVTPNSAAALQKINEEAAADREKRLEELENESIRLGRNNVMGQLVKSAEPYNYWQDMTIKPMGYMTRVVGVFFKGRWNPTSVQIDHLLKKDLGFADPHQKISAIGQSGKRITLTAKTMAIKREIYDILTVKFPQKYSCVLFEEPAVHVTMHFVPEDMPDEVLRAELERYGDLSVEPVVKLVSDLGFHNLQRRIVFDHLRYDIPSYLRIQGYTLQVRYEDQPRTCRICGKRGHMQDKCPDNISNARLKHPESGQKKHGNDAESVKTSAKSDGKMLEESQVSNIVNAMKETIKQHENHGNNNFKSPEFIDMMDKQMQKFKEMTKTNKKDDGSNAGGSKSSQEKFEHPKDNKRRVKKGAASFRPSPHTYGGKRDSSFEYQEKEFPGLAGGGSKRTKIAPRRRKKDEEMEYETDHFDGSRVPVSNRFNALREDLNLSDYSSDDPESPEYRAYVERQNAQYM